MALTPTAVSVGFLFVSCGLCCVDDEGDDVDHDCYNNFACREQ